MSHAAVILLLMSEIVNGSPIPPSNDFWVTDTGAQMVTDTGAEFVFKIS